MASAKGWGGWTGPLERYEKPPSNQKALPSGLFPTEGGERMDEAREWVRSNPAAWEWMVREAMAESAGGGYTSIKRLAAGARTSTTSSPAASRGSGGRSTRASA